MNINNRKIINNLKFPVFTNLRNPKKGIRSTTGRIKLKYDYVNNFIFNEAFEEKKVKYNKNYNNEQSSSTIFKNHLNDVFKIIKTYVKKRDKIIEIGCGKGYFFEILENKYNSIRGFDTTYTGNNKKIQKRYLTIKDCIDEKLIILRHTLEHIHNPYNFLDFLRRISNNDPYILIEATDFWSIKKRQAFFDISYEQPNFFTMETFHNLFSKKLILKKKLFNKQYLLIIAKLNDLNKNYKETEKFKKISLDKLFPKLQSKILSFVNIKTNIFVWGAGTKGLMFLIYLKILDPSSLKKIKFVIDIDKNKQNKFLQIVDKKIVSPKKLLKVIKNNDTIIVANSNYLSEIKNYVKTHKFEMIKYKCLD